MFDKVHRFVSILGTQFLSIFFHPLTLTNCFQFYEIICWLKSLCTSSKPDVSDVRRSYSRFQFLQFACCRGRCKLSRPWRSVQDRRFLDVVAAAYSWSLQHAVYLDIALMDEFLKKRNSIRSCVSFAKL